MPLREFRCDACQYEAEAYVTHAEVNEMKTVPVLCAQCRNQVAIPFPLVGGYAPIENNNSSFRPRSAGARPQPKKEVVRGSIEREDKEQGKRVFVLETEADQVPDAGMRRDDA